MPMPLLSQSKKASWSQLRLVLSLGLIVACANPGKSPEEAAQTNESIETPFANRDADANLARGRVLIDFKFSERMRDVKGSIVGTGPSPSLTPLLDQAGRFQFSPLKPGVYDFILEATRQAQDPSQASLPVALRISGVEVKGGGDIFLRDIELQPYVELSGEVRMLGQGPLAGIEVSIPGTSYRVLSDENGQFKLTHVPAGHHQLVAAYQNFSRGLFETRQFAGSAALPALTIFNDSQLLPVGAHYEGEAVPADGESTITLFLQRPQGMNLFRWGYSSELSNAPWLPYQSSMDFKLGAGQRQLYLQFSRDQKQLSPVYPVSFPAP